MIERTFPPWLECDICGRKCSRLHCTVACGTDTACCDACWGYDWEAYGEDHDEVLHPGLAAELQREWHEAHREPHWKDTP